MVTTTTATGFDTLAYARRLKEAGIDEAQAEAHAEAVRDAIMEGVAAFRRHGRLGVAAEAVRDTIMEGAATKADIERLEAKIATGLAASERRMTLAMVAVAGAAVALTKLLP